MMVLRTLAVQMYNDRSKFTVKSLLKVIKSFQKYLLRKIHAIVQKAPYMSRQYELSRVGLVLFCAINLAKEKTDNFHSAICRRRSFNLCSSRFAVLFKLCVIIQPHSS